MRTGYGRHHRPGVGRVRPPSRLATVRQPTTISAPTADRRQQRQGAQRHAVQQHRHLVGGQPQRRGERERARRSSARRPDPSTASAPIGTTERIADQHGSHAEREEQPHAGQPDRTGRSVVWAVLRLDVDRGWSVTAWRTPAGCHPTGPPAAEPRRCARTQLPVSSGWAHRPRLGRPVALDPARRRPAGGAMNLVVDVGLDSSSTRSAEPGASPGSGGLPHARPARAGRPTRRPPDREAGVDGGPADGWALRAGRVVGSRGSRTRLWPSRAAAGGSRLAAGRSRTRHRGSVARRRRRLLRVAVAALALAALAVGRPGWAAGVATLRSRIAGVRVRAAGAAVAAAAACRAPAGGPAGPPGRARRACRRRTSPLRRPPRPAGPRARRRRSP